MSSVPLQVYWSLTWSACITNHHNPQSYYQLIKVHFPIVWRSRGKIVGLMAGFNHQVPSSYLGLLLGFDEVIVKLNYSPIHNSVFWKSNPSNRIGSQGRQSSSSRNLTFHICVCARMDLKMVRKENWFWPTEKLIWRSFIVHPNRKEKSHTKYEIIFFCNSNFTNHSNCID